MDKPKQKRLKDCRQYWYKFTTYECVMGCYSITHRERVYGPKPEQWHERHLLVQEMCGNHY